METIKCCICNSNKHNVILNSDNNLSNEAELLLMFARKLSFKIIVYIFDLFLNLPIRYLKVEN